MPQQYEPDKDDSKQGKSSEARSKSRSKPDQEPDVPPVTKPMAYPETPAGAVKNEMNREDEKNIGFTPNGGHASNWTFPTFYTHFMGLLDAADDRYTERFQSQTKAVDAALIGQEKAVVAALQASEKAVTKAEATTEKWRENANEWRGAMNDRERLLMPRQEAENQYRSLESKMNEMNNTLGRRFDDMKSQVEKNEGHKSGIESQSQHSKENVNLWMVVLMAAIAMGSLAMSVFAVFQSKT